MAIGDNIRDKKLQYNVNKETAKISALSPGKIDKYKYFTGEEILYINWRQTIEQAEFTYSPLGKALEKQTETLVDALKSLKLSDKLDELKQIEGILAKNLFSGLNIYK